MDACGRGRGPEPCGRPHKKLKLESTDVILSSSHAKKLASFLPEFRLWTESGHFSAICDTNSNVLKNEISFKTRHALDSVHELNVH